MKQEKLADALDELRDDYIMEAMKKKGRPVWHWAGAVAAVLAVALTAFLWQGSGKDLSYEKSSLSNESHQHSVSDPSVPAEVSPDSNPGVQVVSLVAKPEYPEMASYPKDPHDSEGHRQWKASQQQQYDQPQGYADNLLSFYTKSIPIFLADGEKNQVYSPANVYMALAMLAQTTGGETQQEILTALNAESIEDLRIQAAHFWNAHYCDDGLTTLLLANSLWLDDTLPYKQATADTLAKDYHASVYHGDLGSQIMNTALRDWLNENTGGLLQEQVADVELDPETMMALASTIYYKAKWRVDFPEEQSKEGIFHGSDADQTVTYLHGIIDYPDGRYYSGEDYSAVPVPLADGSVMWLILPAEGKTPQDILQSGHALTDLLGNGGNSKTCEIHLQLPKFDVVSQTDLRQGLQALGLNRVLDPDAADFSGITDKPLYLSRADHAARVKIDEKGIEAAAYTLFVTRATGMYSEVETVDFILDRPFLFLVESSSGAPLFTGVVNQP